MAAIAAAAAPSARSVTPTPPGPSDDVLKSLPHDKITCLPITIAIVSVVVSLVAVGLRLYTRHRLLKNLGFDDVCAVLAFLGALALSVTICIQTDYGLGEHVWDLPAISGTYHLVTIYSVSLIFIKLSISWQYYRIVKYDSRYRIPCIAIICAVVGWSIGSMFALLFICNPIDEWWLISPFSDKCDFSRGYTVALGNVVTDFTLVLVPMPMVFRLNIKTPQKLILLAARTAAWTQAEVAAAILGSSTMTLQPLIRHWGVKLGGAHSFCCRASKDGDDQASHELTLDERLDSRPNDDNSYSPGNTPQLRSLEGSETELTRMDDADEMETVRRAETQSHISSTPSSPTFSTFSPYGSGGGSELRRSRHDLDPRGLAVLAQTQCCAVRGGDDTPPPTATADEGCETTGRRRGQLAIQIKRAWSVQEYRYDGRQ